MEFQWKSIEIDLKRVLGVFYHVYFEFFASIGVPNTIFDEILMILNAFCSISRRLCWTTEGKSTKINEN